MRRAGWLAAATATALAVTVVVVAGDEGPPAPPSWPPVGDGILAAGSGLQPFDDCEPLVDHLRAAALHDPSGAGGFFFGDEAVAMEAAPADGDAAGAATTADSARLSGTSDTNVQVAGVDEPDLTETDGRRLFTVSEGTLHVLDVSGPQPQRLSNTPLDVDHGEGQLVLDGDRLLVIAPRWGDLAVPDPAAAREPAADLSMPAHGSALTTILVFDVSRDDPRLVGRTDLEGTHVAGRAIDGTAHLVVAHRPNPIAMPLMEEVWQARSEDVARERLAAALDDTTAEDWLPILQHRDSDGVVTIRPTLQCTDVARAAEEPGTGTLQVVTLDLHGDDALPEATTAVLTDAQTVTASADQLVVATTRWNDLDQPAPAEPAFDAAVEPASQHADTLLHLFELAPTGATHLASGEAPGTLLNQFSMSLHDGHLRVATTAGDAWGGNSESGVTVLRRDGDALEAVGQVAGLGRGETIHSVRFLGDRGYVVTFRQTDPLYSLDLSDPADPRVTGELKITGYSAYLHPMPDDRLLGIGQEATLEGQVTGTQVSMFDVSDPAEPRRESQVHLPGASSEAEWDHHAVLVHDGTLVLPYERWFEPTEERPEGVDVGAVVVDVDGPLEVRGTLHPDADPETLRETGGWQPPIRRVLVVDGRILTLTHDGTLTAWDSATLQATGTLPL